MLRRQRLPMPDLACTTIAELTAEVVAASVMKNAVRPGDMLALIASVHGALARLADPVPQIRETVALTPPVPIRKSVTNDYIVSLETGKRFQSLKRHLSMLGMTPAEYRPEVGLPYDYPMVAPAYRARRSALAKTMGLGNIRRKGRSVPATRQACRTKRCRAVDNGRRSHRCAVYRALSGFAKVTDCLNTASVSI